MTARPGHEGLDAKREIRDFLVSRRAALTPAQAGVVVGPRRRVPGLRRAEVADLAGVSVEYFARLERGEVVGVTEGVVDAIAAALRLDDDERAHLRALVAAVRRSDPVRGGVADSPVRPGVVQVVESIAAPALLVNARTDVLGASPAGRALYADMLATTVCVNYATYLFLDPAARVFYPAWHEAADDLVATVHHASRTHPGDSGLARLVGDLCIRSEEFSRRWAAQTVRRRTYGVKQVLHRDVGALTVSYETLQLPGEPDLAVIVFSAAPGSTSAGALRLLAERATAD